MNESESPPQTTAVWQGTPERLDRAIAALALSRSRSHAATLIASGRVLINNRAASKSSCTVQGGDEVRIRRDTTDSYVSRAATKLLYALEQFEVSAKAKHCLDLGASTGGFTQVLKNHGAKTVIALDVGHGQLAQSVAEMPGVVKVEGFNARELTAAKLQQVSGLADPPTLVVGDLSFISLKLILPAIALTAPAAADLVMLIKPQFEVGRQNLQNGIVKDEAIAQQAVREVLTAAHKIGYTAVALARSPITGTHGNTEYLVHWRAHSHPAVQAETQQTAAGQLEILFKSENP